MIVIFFATDYMLKVFARAAAVSGDGTFKMSPKYWKQLFILCAEISDGIWVPCAFAILPDKKQATYLALFELVKQNLTRIQIYFLVFIGHFVQFNIFICISLLPNKK